MGEEVQVRTEAATTVLAPTIGVKRGCPTMLPEELDAKLCKTVLSLRISGAVNSTTIRGIY